MTELIQLGGASQAIADSIARYTTEADIPAAQQRASIAATQRATNDPGDGVNAFLLNPTDQQAYLAARGKGTTILQNKKVNVATAAEQKKTAMGKPSILPSLDQSYQTAVGGLTGQGRNTMTEYERDIRTMGPNDLRFKYGSRQAADMMGQANKANQEAILDSSASRTAGQAVRDSVVDVGSGFAMPALNIGAFGLGLVNQDAGVSAAQGLAKLNNWTQNTLQSDELSQRRKVNEARNALDSRNSKTQQEIDLSNGDSELYAGLKRLGHGAINAVSNATDDSAILGSGIANGVGSLLSGSVLAKGASMAATKALPLIGANASKAAAAIESAVFPLTVGAMEGAGVYQQTADTIANTPVEQLAKTSETFRGYVASGMSPEQARIQLANRAGITAGAITAPVAAAAGKLVAPFEANPFARASVKTVAQNGAKETLEEGIQSGWGQFSQNLLNKAVVNPNQDMYDQVGEQAGEGGLYGFGTTAAIAGPNAVKNAASDTSKYLWGKASTAINESAANLEASNEAASPLAPNKVAAEVAATQAAMPETAAAIQAGIDTSSLNQEEKKEGQAYARKLTGALSYGENYLADLTGHPLQSVLTGSTGKADAIARLATLVREGGDKPSDVQVAASYLLHGYVADLIDAIENKPAFLDKLPADHPAVQSMASIQATLAKVTAQPMVKKILDQVTALAEAENAKAGANLTEQSMATPEGQLAAQNAANAIAHDPAKANPALVNAVLAHAESGKLVLTEKQQKGIDVAKTLFNASREDFEERKRLGLKTQDVVSNQIQSAEYLGKGQLSALQHANEIYKAYQDNDIAGAKVLLDDFRKFAKSIQNKMAALNEHLDNRRGRKSLNYQTIDQTTREWKTSTDPVGVTPTNEDSVKFMQDVAADAKVIAKIYNNLNNTFSELNGKRLQTVNLDARINKPAAEVVADFKADVQPTVEAKPKIEPKKKTKKAVKPSASDSQMSLDLAPVADPVVDKKEEKVNTLPKPVQEEAKNEQVAESKPISTSATNMVDRAILEEKYPETTAGVDRFLKAAQQRFIEIDAKDELSDLERKLIGPLYEWFNSRSTADLGSFYPHTEKNRSDEQVRAMLASQTTTGSDPDTAVPQATQGSVATAKSEPVNIYYGSNENAELSNLAARPFTFNVRKYLSVEHAYQSNKGDVFDEATFKKYTNAGAKIVGIKGTKTTDGFNLKLMKTLIKASFDQNPDAAKALLATGNSQLTHTQDKGVWAKEFPRILMEVRTALASTPAIEPKKKAESSATTVVEHGADTGIVVPMNYRDGQDASHVMRPEFKGRSTMDLILSGDRTATTGSLNRFNGLTKGSVFTVENRNTGQKTQVRATTDPYLVSEVTAEEWSKLEGWAPSLYAKYKGKTAYQMQYELVNKPATVEPSAPIVQIVSDRTSALRKERDRLRDVALADLLSEGYKDAYKHALANPNREIDDEFQLHESFDSKLRDLQTTLRDLLINTAASTKRNNLLAKLATLSKTFESGEFSYYTDVYSKYLKLDSDISYLMRVPAVVSSLVQEEEADPIEEEDDGDVTPFVYTGEATGLRDEPKLANLFGGKSNRFLDAYKKPTEPISRIALVDAAIETISETVATAESMEDAMGKAPKPGFSILTAKVYSQYVTKVGTATLKKLNENLATWLAYAPKKGKNIGVSRLEQALAPGFVNNWENGKILNVLQNNNGKLSYDSKLVESAVLAGLQWLITSESLSSKLTDKNVASIFGITEDEVPAGLANAMSIGQGELNAVSSLAKKIQEYWGLESNKDYPLNQVSGITSSLAAEVLAAFESMGLLTKTPFTWEKAPTIIDGKTTRQIKTHNRVEIKLANSLGKPENFKALQSYPDAIEQAAMVKPEQTVYLEDERPDIARTQMRNPGAKNKKQALKAIEVNQDTAYKFTHQYKLYEALAAKGFGNLMKLFGFGELTADDKKNKFNKNHLVAVEGKNQSIVSAINGMDYLRAQVEARAEAVGKAPEEIGTHFPHAPSKVQRLQQIGRVTPQGDKNMRAVLSPHESVLDLNDTRSKDYKNFLIAIAQAVGIKIHNIKPEIVHKQIQKLLDNELKPAVDVLQDWAKNMDRPIQDDAADIFLHSFKDAKMDFSNLALQSLTEYALYLNAERSRERTAFPVTLYGEADGMQNGPGGAMMLHSTGPFTVHELQMFRKIGYYPGQKGWTAQDQFAKDNVDTYGTVAQSTQTLIEGLKETYRVSDTNGPRNQVQHMLDLMELLFEGNLSYNNKNELVIKRGAAKSPVTVTIYGAGQQGIASKIAGIIVDELYEKMSAVAAAKYEDPNAEAATVMFGSQEKFDQFTNSWNALTNWYVGFNKNDSKFYLGNAKNNIPRIGSVDHQFAVNYTVEPEALQNLTSNVKKLFVEPMDGAIRETMGESLMNSMTWIRQATQVQTIFLEDAFQTEVKNALNKKEKEDPNFQKGDFLSENELNKILDKLKYMMPKIDNGSQEYYLAGSSAAEVGDVKPFGMSLNEHFKTPATVYGPKDLGVGGIAALNIGMVDGQMIMNFYWDGEVVGTLPVFDGINLPLDKLGEYSEKANKAIFDAWMGNAMKALSESYDIFIKDTDINAYLRSPQLKDKLAKAFLGQKAKGEDVDSEIIAVELEWIAQQLKTAAIDVESRHLAMQDIGAGIDQMAGFSSPHWHEGTISVEGMTNEQIIEVLNERKVFHRSKVIKDQIKSEDISKDLENFGLHTLKSGAMAFYQQNLPLLGSKMNIPKDQKWIFDELTKSEALKDWTFITGTKEQIIEEARKKGVLEEHLNNLEKGLMVQEQKLILLPTASSETLVHEMMHAATFSTVYAHYNGNLTGAVADSVGAAVERLEAIMNQFRNLGEELPVLSTETTQQYLHVRSVIETELSKVPVDGALAKASALNEFMAYTQSNQALIRMTKNTKVSSFLVQAAKDVLAAIKEFIWGKRAPRVNSDMYSNVRFNTALLAHYQPSVAATIAAASTAVLPHSSPKNNLRLQGIRDNFLKRTPNHLKTPLTKDGVLTGKVTSKAIQVATEAAMTLNAHGFPMEPMEQSTFTSIVQALATQAVIDPNTMARAQELFTLATKTLTVADFIDPSNTDAGSALYYANEQYNAVMGNYYEGKDALGRSTLLPVFMGLAITNEKFRGVLSKLELPKTKLKDWDSLDSAFENVGNSLMDKLSLRLSGEGKHAPNVQAAIDALTEHLMSTANDDLLTRMTEGFADWRETRLNKRNNRLLGYIDKGAKALHRVSVNALKNPEYGRFSQTLGKLGELTSAIINEDNAEIVAQGIVSTINKVDGFRTLREVIADIVGRTDSNAEIYDQNKLVRTMVSQDRQHYRDDLPEVILEQFSRAVTKEEMTAMFHGLGKTDIALLRESMKDAEIRELFTKPSALPMAIRAVETQLKTADPQHWNQVEKKAKQLADYMNGKGYGNNLLRNAESVANLFDEPQQAKRTKPDEAYIKAVDKLVSLYAIDGLNNENRSNLSSLVQSEDKGIDFVMAYLTGQRAEEMRKASASLTARMNYFKGFVPSSQDGNVTLVVSSDAEYSKLIGKSYTKVESYKGSSLVQGEPRSYYFANVPSRAAYNQGTMQNARQTAGGIDLATGFTDGLMTAGRITDRKLVYRLAQNLRNERATTEPLLPVRSADGVIVAFERAVDPKQLKRLSQSTDLAKMIGVWRGRQVEEAKVQVFNEALVDAAKKMYKTDLQNSSSKKAEYINVFDPKEQKKDPVLADAVRLLNPETIKYIEDVFGKDTFMVRKDMANDMLGYRNATVGDLWSGNHRWSPETENAVKNLAISVFGNKAYQYMVNGERILQNVVGSAKTLIVMKSIIVPTANLLGNIYQLLSRAVPWLSIAKGLPRKTLEVDSYSKSRRREVKVEALLRAAEGDVMNSRKLSAELQSIRDSYRRMSIWPLIEAGQFSSISDMEVANEDVQLTSGKLHEYIESLVDKLPESIRNAGRYALVTKDTALFQGLQKAVNYGDFIAKAVLYDDLTQRKGLTSKEAMARITEEFVNYDRLPGRSRGYLESVGMLWFYNFKLRLVKIALSTIRNNPVHALVVGMMPKPDLFGSIGTPITDNLFSKAWSGSLGNSIGPGMLFNAPTLLPTVNAVFD